MKGLKSLAIAFSMYSKIPMPRVEWKEENMKYVLCFFPAVGMLEGFFIYGAGKLFSLWKFGTLFFAAAMTLLPLLFTGGIHMDGFLDTLDALASWGEKEKKLEILKDPHTGAFAVLGAGMYLLWSVALWSEVPFGSREALLFTAACGCVFSRALCAFAVMTFPAAKKEGLLWSFHDKAAKNVTVAAACFWMFAAASVMVSKVPLLGGGAVFVGVAVFSFFRRKCTRQFGGMTGDLAGYFLQMCELAMLTAAVILSHR